MLIYIQLLLDYYSKAFEGLFAFHEWPKALIDKYLIDNNVELTIPNVPNIEFCLAGVGYGQVSVVIPGPDRCSEIKDVFEEQNFTVEHVVENNYYKVINLEGNFEIMFNYYTEPKVTPNYPGFVNMVLYQP
ncbi:MAG: hypothetical protein WBJ28_02085 [Bacilli bacterium]|jgi:hypothetical protein|nr:hypothetical protein [Bacillota bacterium]NLI52222.1 hypothetical protein [Erysipelotrichaceae bacterium]OQC49954.1 MAG: hypothetical protein BWX57_00640 [Tenericutes bacterium ADurb.Bin024]HOM32648.1 hypothetical protein [Bacilli bacterium]TAH58338.1 MAG: hypothetical protein EWM49_03640 [Bacillota bacterium]